MRFVVMLLATMLLSNAEAQNNEIAGLLKHSRTLDGICRGGGVDDAELRDATCCGRTQIGVRLNQLGWCYGKQEQIGADMRWHRCTRTSNRFNPQDYCDPS
jgi:hypothetical protein